MPFVVNEPTCSCCGSPTRSYHGCQCSREVLPKRKAVVSNYNLDDDLLPPSPGPIIETENGELPEFQGKGAVTSVCRCEKRSVLP